MESRNAEFICRENIKSLRMFDELVDFHKESYVQRQRKRNKYIVI